MNRICCLATLLLLATLIIKADDWEPFMAEALIDTTQTMTLGLKEAKMAETVTIFEANDSTDHYVNGAVMTVFKGVLYCMWQSSAKDEDSEDTWVAYSRSVDDGKNWSRPEALIRADKDAFYTSGGWLLSGDTIIAFINRWPKNLEPRSGYTYYLYSCDGVHWSQSEPVKFANGNPIDGVIEQDPLRLHNGRIIGAAHFQPGLHVCPIYTDDPIGISGWRKSIFQSEDRGGQSRELEPSQYVTPDGIIIMVFRDQKSSFRKLAAYSNNWGESWSIPTLTNIPDSRVKQCAGNLKNGTCYLAGNPVNGKQRFPLTILFSRDGRCFDKALLLRSGCNLPQQCYPGKAKTLGYNYPKSFSDGRWIYVTYTTNKERVEYTRIPCEITIY